jgi:hypothetical protein
MDATGEGCTESLNNLSRHHNAGRISFGAAVNLCKAHNPIALQAIYKHRVTLEEAMARVPEPITSVIQRIDDTVQSKSDMWSDGAMTVQCCGALPGAGKTTTIIRTIKEALRQRNCDPRSGYNIVYIAPTLQLIDQTFDELDVKRLDSDVETIRSNENVGRRVLDSFVQYVKDGVQIIAMTQACNALMQSEHYILASEYGFIYDEDMDCAIQIEEPMELLISENGIFNTIARMEPTEDEDTFVLELRGGRSTQNYKYWNYIKGIDSETALDSPETKKIIKAVYSDAHIVTLTTMAASVNKSRIIDIAWSPKHLSCVKWVRYYSAFIEHTELYAAFVREGFKCVEVSSTCELRDMTHRLKKITLLPLYAERVYSKSFSQEAVFYPKERLEELKAFYKKEGKLPSWAYNVVDYTSLVMKADYRLHTTDEYDDIAYTNVIRGLNSSDYKLQYKGNAKRKLNIIGDIVCTRAHGMNSVQDRTAAIVPLAFNEAPSAKKFAQYLRPDFNVFRSRTTLQVWQFIMRCAYRNPKSSKAVTALTSDVESTMLLQDLVPECSIGEHALFDQYAWIVEDTLTWPDNWSIETHTLKGKIRKLTLNAEERKENRHQQYLLRKPLKKVYGKLVL